MENLKVNVVENKPCFVTLNVEVPHPEVKTETEKVFQQIQKSASVPGFRQGKAPMEMIKKNFVENAKAQVVQNLAEKAVFSALKLKGIEPIDYPKIQELSFDFDKPFKFKVEAEKHPEFKVREYKGIKAKKEIREISDAKVQESIDALRDRNAKLVEAKGDAITDKSFVTVDYEAFHNGQALAELKAKNQLLDLSSAQLIVGFKEGLVGAKKDDTKEIEVQFPQEYPNKNLAGKKCTFKTTVKEIKEKSLPEANDDFAKDLGLKDFGELKNRLKDNLAQEEKQRQEEEVRAQIIEHLLKYNTFEVPKTFVQEQFEAMTKKMEGYFRQQGLPEKTWKETLEKNKDKYMKEAENNVRVSYIFREIANEEKIDVTEEDLTNELETMKKENAGREKEVEKYFNEKKGQIASSMKESRIYKFLVDSAKIKEKTVK